MGGSGTYVVWANRKRGGIRPALSEPQLNPVYAALLAHYSAVADPARVRDPNRKGVVENAIQHTQTTALKGRKFESRRAEQVARALGRALGGPKDPRAQKAAGYANVPGGEAVSEA